MSKKLKKYDLLKKSSGKVFVPKTSSVYPLYDLLIEIDYFFHRVKQENNIDPEEKAKILKSFNKMIASIDENFHKLSQKTGIEFNTPLSVEVVKKDLKK